MQNNTSSSEKNSGQLNNAYIQKHTPKTRNLGLLNVIELKMCKWRVKYSYAKIHFLIYCGNFFIELQVHRYMWVYITLIMIDSMRTICCPALYKVDSMTWGNHLSISGNLTFTINHAACIEMACHEKNCLKTQEERF